MDSQIVAVFLPLRRSVGSTLPSWRSAMPDQRCRSNDHGDYSDALLQRQLRICSAVLEGIWLCSKMLGKSRLNRRLHRIRELFPDRVLYAGRDLERSWMSARSTWSIAFQSRPAITIASCVVICIEAKSGEVIKPAREVLLWSEDPSDDHRIKSTQLNSSSLLADIVTRRLWHLYQFDLPKIKDHRGQAYNDYDVEDALHEAGLHLIPLRKRIPSALYHVGLLLDVSTVITLKQQEAWWANSAKTHPCSY